MKPFRLYISSHAKQRLFERRGVLLTHEEEQAITETLDQERSQWPEGIKAAYITITLNAESFELVLKPSLTAKDPAYDAWTVVTIMTGKKSLKKKLRTPKHKPVWERDWKKRTIRKTEMKYA
jgi:hypothetical protein